MNTRIRYVVDGNGLAVSTRVINTNHGEVLVRYNKTSKVAQIYLASDEERVIDTFQWTNDFKLKKDIKAKLIAMGAQFASESRESERKQVLSDKELFLAWENALDNQAQRNRSTYEGEKVFIARCWADGLFDSLIRNGWVVCLKKNGEEIVLKKD